MNKLRDQKREQFMKKLAQVEAGEREEEDMQAIDVDLSAETTRGCGS